MLQNVFNSMDNSANQYRLQSSLHYIVKITGGERFPNLFPWIFSPTSRKNISKYGLPGILGSQRPDVTFVLTGNHRVVPGVAHRAV